MFRKSYARFHTAVSLALPRRRAERPVQLAPHNWLDAQRRFKCRYHLLLLCKVTKPSGIQQEWKDHRPPDSRGNNVHVCRVGRQLPDGACHQLLHLNPAHIHLGWNLFMVSLPSSIWSHAFGYLNNCV